MKAIALFLIRIGKAKVYNIITTNTIGWYLLDRTDFDLFDDSRNDSSEFIVFWCFIGKKWLKWSKYWKYAEDRIIYQLIKHKHGLLKNGLNLFSIQKFYKTRRDKTAEVLKLANLIWTPTRIGRNMWKMWLI